MIVSKLIQNLPILITSGSIDTEVENVCIDSRLVNSGSIYIAIKGTQVDGHDFIIDVVSKGCKCILISRSDLLIPEGVTVLYTENTMVMAGFLASNFYENPSRKMKVIAITGTNGKTSVATLSYQLFKHLGYSCGLLSTVENIIDKEVIPASHTTPDPVSLQSLLSRMVERGCTHVFMEASSHAIHQYRISGIQFTGAVFTNITHDHLDYHGSFSEYIQAKKMLFDSLPISAWAISNKDDKNGMVMLQNCKASKFYFSLQQSSDFHARILESDFNGTLISIRNQELYCRLFGKFNIYNLLSVFGIGFLLGEEEDKLISGLSLLSPPRGRFEILRSRIGIIGIVDYAHTPDALENILETIQEIRTRNEKLMVVIGCGGNRDITKRPLMGDIAARYSDKVIFTSDNPRDEDPLTIMEDMMKGVQPLHFKKTLRIADRREAIKTAVSMCNPGDILLIAGKGHESYQEILGIKHSFDDMNELKTAFEFFEK